MKDLCILVSSAGRRVELIECFRRSARDLGISLKVVASDLDPAMSAACRTADVSAAVPRCNAPDFVDATLEIVRRHGVALVVPTIDPELEPLSRASERFRALGARVHVSAPSVIEVARDKLLTAKALDAAGVPVPRTIALTQALGGGAALQWPMFLKPASGSASRGILVVRDPSELPSCESEPMILQQLLRGPEFTVNMFVDRHGSLRCVVPHRRLRVRAGEVEKGRTERNPLFERFAAGILQALPEARGSLCFQLIDDEETGPRVFEINARFGGGYPLAHHAGAHFAKWLLEEIADLPASADRSWREGAMMLRYDAAVFSG